MSWYQKTSVCIYLEPKWPLFLKVNPPKQGPFQSKQGSFGFQVYIYLYLYTYVSTEYLHDPKEYLEHRAFLYPKKRHETIFASTIFSSWRRHGKKRCLRRIAGQLLVTRRCIEKFRLKKLPWLFRHTKRMGKPWKPVKQNSPVELRVFLKDGEYGDVFFPYDLILPGQNWWYHA